MSLGEGRVGGWVGLGKKKLLSLDSHQKVPKWVSPASGWNPLFSLGQEHQSPQTTPFRAAKASFYKPRPKPGLADIGAVSRVGYSRLVWVLYLLCLHVGEEDMYVWGLCFGGSAPPSRKRYRGCCPPRKLRPGSPPDLALLAPPPCAAPPRPAPPLACSPAPALPHEAPRGPAPRRSPASGPAPGPAPSRATFLRPGLALRQAGGWRRWWCGGGGAGSAGLGAQTCGRE